MNKISGLNPSGRMAPPIHTIVQQHAEESAILHNIRSRLVHAPHIKLPHLFRFDDRLAAHLDGLAVAGGFGSGLCDAELETPSAGRVFAAAVRAIEEKDLRRLDRLFALVEAVPECMRGLTSAFGWVSPDHLTGTDKSLLDSDHPLRRTVGLAASAMHRINPGPSLDRALVDPDATLRARALRIAGECGRSDLLPACLAALEDNDPDCRFRAGWSAVLLGNRGRALVSLSELIFRPGPFRAATIQLVLRVVDRNKSLEYLKRLARDPGSKRELIQGAGVAGNPNYILWLLDQMENPNLARPAGESFSLITGLDLSDPDVSGKPPDNFESGPNDNPDDEDVDVDPDEDLPWPDHEKTEKWWDKNQHRFAVGVAHFMGEPVSIENCQRVLREGYQRQRMAAAVFLSLYHPGAPLFPTNAPAWRQQRLLDATSSG